MNRIQYVVLALCVALFSSSAGARSPKLKFGSEFARKVYQANTCASVGDLVYPASSFATGPLLKNWPRHQLTLPGVSECDKPYLEPLAIVTDEVLLGGRSSFWVSIAGEPCVPEPTVILNGKLEDLYVDPDDQTSLIIRLAAAGIEKHCGKLPPSLQVRVRTRSIQDDPAKPATRKKVAGKMLVREETYAGQYVLPPPLNRYGQWKDADPKAREEYMARVRNRNDSTSRVARREADAAVYQMENEQEIRAAMRAFGAGLDSRMRMQLCGDILYRNNPNNVNYTQQDIDECRKFMAEPLDKPASSN
jgi:hypothetical protein